MNCSSIPDYTHALDLVVALGGRPGAFFFSFSNDYPYHHYLSTKFHSNEQQEEKRGADRLSYDRAAGTYERAMLEGYPAAGAQELAMRTLTEGLRYSKYAILREVVENEFADDVPEAEREAFTRKLLPLVGNVFSIYDLSDDNFALSPEYDLLYTELTGAVVLYIEEYGV